MTATEARLTVLARGARQSLAEIQAARLKPGYRFGHPTGVTDDGCRVTVCRPSDGTMDGLLDECLGTVSVTWLDIVLDLGLMQAVEAQLGREVHKEIEA